MYHLPLIFDLERRTDLPPIQWPRSQNIEYHVGRRLLNDASQFKRKPDGVRGVDHLNPATRDEVHELLRVLGTVHVRSQDQRLLRGRGTTGCGTRCRGWIGDEHRSLKHDIAGDKPLGSCGNIFPRILCHWRVLYERPKDREARLKIVVEDRERLGSEVVEIPFVPRTYLRDRRADGGIEQFYFVELLCILLGKAFRDLATGYTRRSVENVAISVGDLGCEGRRTNPRNN